MLLSVRMSVTYTFFKKITHGEKAPSNKTPALTENTNMDKLPWHRFSEGPMLFLLDLK